MTKITLRTFRVTLRGSPLGTMYFVGPEYTEEKAKQFLISEDGMSRDIQVKLVREVTK